MHINSPHVVDIEPLLDYITNYDMTLLIIIVQGFNAKKGVV